MLQFIDPSGGVWLQWVIHDPAKNSVFDAIGSAALGLESHKAFIIYCAIGEELNLLYHFDNAEVMLNVNCGDQFTGGYLYFRKIKMLGQVKMCMFLFE